MGHIEAELHGRGDLIDILPARAGGADEFLMNFFLIDRDRGGNSNHVFSVRRVGFSGKRGFSPGQEASLRAWDTDRRRFTQKKLFYLLFFSVCQMRIILWPLIRGLGLLLDFCL